MSNLENRISNSIKKPFNIPKICWWYIYSDQQYKWNKHTKISVLNFTHEQ